MNLDIWELNKKIIHDDKCFIGEIRVFDEKEIFVNADFHFPSSLSGTREYCIGSLSKIFIAHLAFLVLKDLDIALSTKIARLLTELPSDLKDISIHDLIYHKSGIANFTTANNFFSLLNSAQSKDDVYEFIFKLNYHGKVAYNYSNSNYFLLGIFLERASSKTLAELFKQYICNPLGLKNSRVLDSDDLKGNTNNSYGEIVQAQALKANSILFGAGNISSSSDDLITYFRFVSANKDLFIALPFKKKCLNKVELFFHGGICPGYQSLVYIDPMTSKFFLSLSNSDSSLREEILNSLVEDRILPRISKAECLRGDGIFEFEFEDGQRLQLEISEEGVFILDENFKLKLFYYDLNYFSVKDSHDNFFRIKQEKDFFSLENYTKKGDGFEILKAKLIS